VLLLAGVRASAAQNTPVNTICSQCGSVLASGEHTCNFCETPQLVPLEETVPQSVEQVSNNKSAHVQWRGELNDRLQAYRARRKKASPDIRQSALPFDDGVIPTRTQVTVDESSIEPPSQTDRTDDFAFTIAIGRIAHKEADDGQVLIDVSNPPQVDVAAAEKSEKTTNTLFRSLPIASLDHRRRALLIDAACLAFAYGSFLALFGSLGGHFTLSKLSAAVCLSTFAFVYVQYFGLFTVFGGSTPGMMLAGLHVASATGDVPTPRQYFLRAIGYLLSAGTCFLGFLWVLWDEDELTWHDRISKTYLAEVESFLEEDSSHAATAR
jgi:uncharacterized RDD family membrane protein YckC